jgi:hypothetical protein
MIDADGDKLTKTDAAGLKVDNPDVRHKHVRDNRAMIRLLGGDEENVFPTGVLWDGNLVVWPADFATTIKQEFIIALGAQGEERFKSIENDARADAGNAGDLGKNSVYIGHLLTRLAEAKVTSPSLDKLCERIVILAKPAAPAHGLSAIPVLAATP